MLDIRITLRVSGIDVLWVMPVDGSEPYDCNGVEHGQLLQGGTGLFVERTGEVFVLPTNMTFSIKRTIANSSGDVAFGLERVA